MIEASADITNWVDPDRTSNAVDGRRYDVYNPHLDTPTGPLRKLRVRPIVEVVADDKVILDVDAMEIDRPYTYQLGGEWLAALKRPDGHIDFVAIR